MVKRKMPSSYVEPNWNNPGVREDLAVQVNFRLPEKLVLKINWVSVMEGVSKRQVVEDAIAHYVAVKIRKYGATE